MIDIENIKYHNFRKGKILVIEDNADQSVIIDSAIKQCIPEMQTIIVNTAHQALNYLDDVVAARDILPKLILLDLYLPTREDGWHVLRKIKRSHTPITMLPVIVLSASENAEDIRDTYIHGGSAYIVKPSDYPSWLDYFTSIRKHWMETVILPYKS